MIHMVPFHCSAKGTTVPLLSVAADEPTAVHAVGVVHETAVRLAAVGPTGLGVDTTDQVLPSHDSASDICVNGYVTVTDPTAVHAVAVVHETLLRMSLG
jgi:hypothetical protein